MDYVLFDEGHREPSRICAQAVRHLERPIILFSATPCRSDYAYLDIDDRYYYNEFSYQKALKYRYIRKVEFVEIDFDREDPESFVEHLLDYYDDQYSNQGHEPRVIIHCRNKNNVIAVAEGLEERCRSVVAVHEKLSSSEKDCYRRKAQKPDEIFWVYQHKLLEGIDVSSFQLLALYDEFKNALSLVQQIGRIIRNPGRLPGQVAVVFTKPQDGQKTFWRQYEAYEKSDSPYYNLRDLYEQALKQQPPILYVEGNYRKCFNIDRDNVHLAFRYPCSANVFVPMQSIDIDLSGLKEKTVEEWRGKVDRYVGKVVCPDDDTVVIPYVTGQNAPVLLQDYFIELSLGFTIIRREEGYIFIYDSRGSIPKALQEVAQSVETGKIAHLFSGDDARASSLCLVNSDIGRRSIRRRTMQAHSIAETAPSLADHLYVYSALRGSVPDQRGGLVGRYIGFTRGRVTDRVSGLLDYNNYIKWIREVANFLSNDRIEPNALLKRYAVCIGEPEDTTPRHILLDLDMDILICDDLQKEVADFIAASRSEKRVVLIHAKASDGELSASAFQDVCGQAVKNLEILNPSQDRKPPNLDMWDGSWVRAWPEEVERRIRKGKGKAQDLWVEMHDIIRNPAATREVWIVYGKGFSLKTLKEEQQNDDPRPEAIQLLYLLQSTWASVASIGAHFRIFCPKEPKTPAQSNPANSIRRKLVSSSQDLR